jgi:hypothetical protein
MRIEIIDDDIPIIEIFFCKHKIEIFSDRMKKSILTVNISHFLEILSENIAPILDIKDTDPDISDVAINIKIFRRFVVVVHDMSEKVVVLGRMGNIFQIVCKSSSLFVLVVDSPEKLGVETKLGEESNVCRTMSESIDLPTHFRNIPNKGN